MSNRYRVSDAKQSPSSWVIITVLILFSFTLLLFIPICVIGFMFHFLPLFLINQMYHCLSYIYIYILLINNLYIVSSLSY